MLNVNNIDVKLNGYTKINISTKIMFYWKNMNILYYTWFKWLFFSVVFLLAMKNPKKNILLFKMYFTDN